MKDYFIDYLHMYLILAVALLCAIMVISGNGDVNLWDFLR